MSIEIIKPLCLFETAVHAGTLPYDYASTPYFA